MRTHDYKIHMKGARAEMPVRHEPYWRKVGDGYLGFRKHSNPANSFWVARWTSAEMQAGKGARRKTYKKTVGSEQDMTFEQAAIAAREWFEQCIGGVVHAGTVEEACRAYVENQRIEKGDAAASFSEGRFKQLVYGKPIGMTKLDELRDWDVTNWRNKLQEGRRKNSANRDLRSFKAALNFAVKRKLVATDSAWRHVEPFKGAGAADRPRTVYLPPALRRRLLDACDQDAADLLRGLLLTAARPLSNSELPVAKVGDFDARTARLTLRTVKGTGVERVRHVPLSDAAVDFLKRMTKNKLPGAYLFTRGGQQWKRHQWSEAITKAVALANSTAKDPEDRLPDDCCAYTMRHCAITDRLRAGENIGHVAKDAGTSIAMIEKYYAKYIDDAGLREKLNTIVAF